MWSDHWRIHMSPKVLTRICLLAVALPAIYACQDQQQAPVQTTLPPTVGRMDSGMVIDLGQMVDDAALTPDASPEVDAGTIPDAEVDSAQFEVVPFAVETRVGERRTAAGIENRITCQVLDQVGEPITDIVARPEIYPDTGFERRCWRHRAIGEGYSVVVRPTGWD